MVDNFPETRLGEFISERKEFFTIDDFARYKRARVQLHGKGIVLRDEVQGSEIKTKKQQAARAGELLVAEIDAKVGGFGIVSPELDAAIVSSHYFLFEINEQKCLRAWLDWFIRSGMLEEQVAAQGSTNYAAIRPSHVLKYQIPLPPIAEQQRIVARVEELARRVEEARGLRRAAAEEAETLMRAASAQLFNTLEQSGQVVPIGETFSFRNDLIRPTDGKSGSIRFIGLQHVESHTGKKIGEDSLFAEELTGRKFKFSPGEIVYGYLRPYLNKVWIADTDGICSVDQYVIRPKPELINTSYLAHFMRSASFLRQAIELTHNLLLPRLRTALLESIPISLPSLSEQHRIVAHLDGLQAKVDELRRLQAETQKELDALMPSILAKAFAGEL